MKKILSYLSLAITGLLMAACSEDFKDWATQTTYPQEEVITIPGFTASAAGVVDLSQIEGSTSLVNLSAAALPEGFSIQSLRVELTPAEGEGTTTELKADADGKFTKADLQSLIEQAYGKRPVARQFTAHVYATAVKDGQGALIDAGTVQLSLIPEAPQISENYYIIGGPNAWQESAEQKMLKFSHSGKDVYEDPVFTVVFPATDADTWFAIGDDEACDAIAINSDWSKLLGTTKGNGNTDPTGSLDRRYNLSDEGSFCVPAGYKLIKVTINMMDYSYAIEGVNISENYYLIGGPGNWDSSKDQKFAHSSKSVFDDPVFTYVFEGSGSDMWFAFGDEEAIDAVGAGVWNQLFGTTGASEDLSGSFDRRYNLDGDHSFHVDGLAKYYRLTVNMMAMTYEITPLNFGEFFYEIGNESGWSTSHALYGGNGDGQYQGYYYLDGEYKFKPNADNWNDDLEYVDGSTLGGTLTDAGGPNCPDPGAGFYQINLDAAAMTYSLTPITSVSMIGGFNGWGDDLEMTYNKEEGCWEVTTDQVSGEFKFRANHDWGINWGGDTEALTQDGANLNIDGGTHTFKLYLSYNGAHRVTIE